jgi:hypothetical protein
MRRSDKLTSTLMQDLNTDAVTTVQSHTVRAISRKSPESITTFRSSNHGLPPASHFGPRSWPGMPGFCYERGRSGVLQMTKTAGSLLLCHIIGRLQSRQLDALSTKTHVAEADRMLYIKLDV